MQPQQLFVGCDLRLLAHLAGFDWIRRNRLQALALRRLQLAVLQVQPIQHTSHQKAVGDGALPGVEQFNRAQREAGDRAVATAESVGLLRQVLLQDGHDFSGIEVQAIGQLVHDRAQKGGFGEAIAPCFLERFNHRGADPRVERQLTHGEVEAFAAFTQPVAKLLQLGLGIARIELTGQASPLTAREALAQGVEWCAEAGHSRTNAAQCCLDS